MTERNKNLIELRRSIVRWILSFVSPRVATASRSEGNFHPNARLLLVVASAHQSKIAAKMLKFSKFR